LRPPFRKALLAAGAVLALSAVAEAEPATSSGEASGASVRIPLEAMSMPAPPPRGPLSDADAQALRQVLDALKRGDVSGARMNLSSISDPVARKVATWQFADAASSTMSFFELDQARRDLAGWPRDGRRQIAAEKRLESSGLSAKQIVDWFAGAEPQTAEGAMALAGAYRVLNRSHDAKALIGRIWREKPFDSDLQRQILMRFPDAVSADDHVRRADMILYGPDTQAARDMLPLLPYDQQQLALARIALRTNAANANDLVSALPASVSNNAGLAFERAAYLRRRGLDTLALGLLQNFPKEPATPAVADRIWNERYQLTLLALRNGDSRAAYGASANSGLTSGGDAADAEFYAGWIALRRLNNPTQADVHFANLERIGSSPITRGRALYWRGRAAEARGDRARAQEFYGQAAKYYTTFYGQLAGEKVGGGKLVLPPDPAITPADRARFEGREPVQAARLLYQMGQRDLFRALVLGLDDILPSAEEEAMLIDLARGYGEQDASMKVARAAAQRGFVLPQRGYPFRTPPQVYDAPEAALILGITRQESGFDPLVRSGAGARGMMQLMPATAAVVARRNGMSYSPGMLDDPDYNMRLGSSYLGQVINTYSGSYVMGIASYNAGPGRPAQWSAFCGDPRGGTTDPIDFIECIPFGETRNYVMRVMEGMQVYRAKLNGGSAPITLSSDLRRGGYGYPGPATQVASQPTTAVAAQP
jgi:soluble lytic murein transglycosylase